MAKQFNNKSRKPGKAGKKQRKERPVYEYDLKVTRVLDGKYGVLFDLQINNVTVYGCRMCETREGVPFVGWPQKQDRKDKDKWWSIAYAPLTDDQVKIIWDQIAAELEGDEDEEDEDE